MRRKCRRLRNIKSNYYEHTIAELRALCALDNRINVHTQRERSRALIKKEEEKT